MNLSESSEDSQLPEVKTQNRLRQSFFAKLWESKIFSDFEIHVEGQVITTHKIVICTFSDVFVAMLGTNCVETTHSQMSITDFSHKVVRLMLEYIYLGKFTTEMEESAEDLLRIADKYNIVPLKAKAARQMISNITVDNVLKVLVLADASNVAKLKENAVAFIRLNYKLVRESDGFTAFYKQYPTLLLSILDAELSYAENKDNINFKFL